MNYKILGQKLDIIIQDEKGEDSGKDRRYLYNCG